MQVREVREVLTVVGRDGVLGPGVQVTLLLPVVALHTAGGGGHPLRLVHRSLTFCQVKIGSQSSTKLHLPVTEIGGASVARTNERGCCERTEAIFVISGTRPHQTSGWC